MTATLILNRARADLSREDWLRWRRQGIGGSDAPAVVGLSPFKTPTSVWLAKSGLIPDDEPSEAMLWGNLLEAVVIEEFERRTGLHVEGRQGWVESPTWPVMRATVDGLVCDDEHVVLGLYEGKTANAWDAKEWAEGVPEHYQVQVQHSLAVTGLDHAWVACLVGGQQLVIHELDRNDEQIAIIAGMERTFWQWVLDGTPPAVDGSAVTADALAAAYAAPAVATSVELPEEALDVLAERQQAAEDEKQAGERKALAENQLKAMLGTAELGTYGNRTLVTWKQVTEHRLDGEALAKAHPDIVKRFTTPRTYRRFNVPTQREEK